MNNLETAKGITAGPDSNTVAETHSSWFGGASDWATGAASDVWSATTGAARVAGQLGLGFADQVIEHPLETAAEVAGGVVVAAVAAEAGIGLAGAAAIAAVPAIGYGIYRGVQIASTEGIGAIPSHVEATYDQAADFVSNAGNAIASVYHGTAGSGDMAASERQVQDLGKAAVPLVAGAIGGASGELGQIAFQGGVKTLTSLSESVLPSLTLEPAYAGLAPAAIAGASRGTVASESTLAAAGATTTGAGVVQHMESSNLKATSQASSELDPYRAKSLFVEGRVAAAPAAATAEERTLTGAVSNAFRDADQIIAKGGRLGNMEIGKTADGWLQLKFVDGPMQDSVAFYQPGDSSFLMTKSGAGADAHILPMAGRQ
jgi:hypothetical protein